jgi:hypothetical protein
MTSQIRADIVPVLRHQSVADRLLLRNLASATAGASAVGQNDLGQNEAWPLRCMLAPYVRPVPGLPDRVRLASLPHSVLIQARCDIQLLKHVPVHAKCGFCFGCLGS